MVRKEEVSYRKTMHSAAASQGGGGDFPVVAPTSAVGKCTSFFSCKSRSKSVGELSIPVDLGERDDIGTLTALHHGVPIALELAEDAASVKLKNKIKELEAMSDAYETLENALNERFFGLCQDSE